MKKLFSDINVRTEVNTTVEVGKDRLRLGRSVVLPLAVYAGTFGVLYVLYTRIKMRKGKLQG